MSYLEFEVRVAAVRDALRADLDRALEHDFQDREWLASVSRRVVAAAAAVWLRRAPRAHQARVS